MSAPSHRISRIEAGEIRARLPQNIKRVPVFAPALCRVRLGVKRIWLGEREMSAGPERLVLLPAGIEADIANLPGPDGYLADIVSLPPGLLNDFRLRHGPLLLQQRPGFELCPRLEPRVESAWNALLDSLRANDPPEMSAHHACGVLLALALAGQIEPLLRPAAGGITERVRHLLLLDPAASWSVDMAARRLNQGASTLRRHLAEEGSSFRGILESLRMGLALQQVQNGERAIADIAVSSGYASASRFSARFRQRYGLTPSELRRTL
ncbi:AraC family transcriptional regulator [Chromobacterium sp. IIBBL 290-4]|uniref:helix-turn-helix transcriptional regulator n=1 Tax=Chromobacterium sp. IIBBL 290-4 TaxID=2953890 RepID=UPI0020B7AE90|nr:AraC family transcriptional regulator [Chromobacterium sp. IIBBL 290-4]UTH74369.1 AraC family transcriptional regulator [Chromobacterium sp. IIBBL 290-4]